MKKFVCFFAILGICSLGHVGAQDITVADGTDQFLYFPISSYHWTESQHSQSLYPAEMLSELQGKYITALTWYPTANLANGWMDPQTQTIRLGITNASDLEDGLVHNSTSIVWTGQLPRFFGTNDIRVPLDTPFLYNGGNLLVEIVKGGAADCYHSASFYGQNQSTIMSLNQVGTYYAPYTGSSLPKLTFGCANGLCANPEYLQVSDITPESATLSWSPGIHGVAEAYVVAYRSDIETEFTEVTVTDTFLTLAGLHPITPYTWKVKAVCSDTTSSEWSLENSFTTQRRKATIPYFCDFEDSTENVNWNLPINPDAVNNRWHVGSYISYSGNHSLYVSSNNGATNLTYGFGTMFPAWAYREFVIDTLYPQYQISFKHRGYEHFTAYWGPPAAIFGSAPLILQPAGSVNLNDSQSLPQGSDWSTHNYTFSVDTPGIYRLYFDWRVAFEPNTGRPTCSIDDISIEGIPCLAAHTLTATNITDSSATISWEYNCVNTPMGYEVGYKTAGDYNYTVFTVYDTTAVTLTGLQPHTTYYWRVKTLYDDSFVTDWSSEANFLTDLVWVHPLPYTCDFEDATENLAWNVPAVSGNNINRWCVGHNTYNSSSTSLYITTAANGSNNSYNNLSESQTWTYRDLYFDPQYDAYELSFDAKVKGSAGYAFAQLFVGEPVEPTDSLAAQSMVMIDDMIGPTVNNNNAVVWKNYEYTLDSTFSGHKRIFFLWQNHSNNYRYEPAIAIDNIVVSGTRCPHPLNMVTDLIFDTTARISWQNVSSVDPISYTVAYKSTSDSVYTLLETSDTSLTLNALQPITNYTWKVRSNCSADEHSEWSHEESFQTFRRLATLPYTCDFEDPEVYGAWLSHYDESFQQWCVGSAVQHNGQNTCYVSSDYGATCETIDYTYYDTYMYQDFLFDTTYSEYVLEFDFKTLDTTADVDLEVYVITPASPSNFVAPAASNLVGQVNFTDTLWHPIRIVIDRSHSGIQRLAFRWQKMNYNTLKKACAIDDITFNGSEIGRPFHLSSSNITHNSAFVTWESNNRHAPAAYELLYRKDGDTTYTAITLTDTVCTISSLSPNTLYYWKARAIAATNEISEWSDEVKFGTAGCTPYQTSFEDDIDKISWLAASYLSDKWLVGNAVSCDGAYSLYISSDNGVSNSSVLTYANTHELIGIYRDIYIEPGAEEYQIIFDYLGRGASIQLQSLENPTSHAVFSASIPTSDHWQHQRITVDSSYAGLNRLFFKRSLAALSDLAGAIDNLVVEASTCPPPTILTSALTLPNAVRVTWNSVGSPSYQVAYKIQGDSSYTELEVNDTSVVISNLQADIPYFWKVRSECNGTYGDWSSEYSFLTMPLLPYMCDFESAGEVAHWTYDVPNEWNYWNIGAAPIDNGNATLHVACAAWGQGSYNYFASANLWAYRDIYIPDMSSKCQISFDYRGLGENGADFARVYIGPPTTPSGFSVPVDAEQIGGDFCMVPAWSHFSFEADSTHTGLQRLYFLWHCNDMNGLNPGAAFDNIAIQVSDCAIPTNPEMVHSDATTAVLSWHPGNADALPSSYTVAYRLMSDTVFTETNTTDTVLQITGLLPDSYYYWWVRANCSSTEHSLWSNSGFFATSQQAYASVPYECGFEDAEENAAWSHLHIQGDNAWAIGTATTFEGDSSLYVSSDSGTTYAYTNTAVSTDWVYRDIYFPPGNDEYEISFDFKGKGRDAHYARVYLGRPEMMFENFTPQGAELLGGSLYNINDWQHFSYHLSAAHSGLQRLYILWQNNTYSLSLPPAAIDNIVISAQPCSEPVNLVSEATVNDATLSWTMRFGDIRADYTVAYRSQNDSMYTYVNVSDTFLILQNLDSNTYYYWKVRQNCDTTCSIWSENCTFYTNENVLYIFDFDSPNSISPWVIPQDRGQNQWYAGQHSESTYNGTLYVSSDGGQNNIYDITDASNSWAYTDVYIPLGSVSSYLSFDFKGMGETNYDYLNVYVAPPTTPSGNTAPAGAMAFEKIGMNEQWTHYNYAINAAHTGHQRIYLLWHNDFSGGTNPPASIDNICLSREILPLMEEITASPLDTTALITWDDTTLGDPVSYTISYAKLTADSTMTEITVPNSSCDLYGLTPNTDYFCKVRANYANGNFSSWAMTQFRTLPPFINAPYHCDFESETENANWQLITDGSANQWVIDTAVTNGGNQSLYISNDGGATNAYTLNDGTDAWAYRNIYLDPAQAPYVLSFDYKGEGEKIGNTFYDYAKVFIGPPVVPSLESPNAEFTQLDETLCLQTNWTTHEVMIDNEHTGYISLFLYWRNDASFGTNPAAAFDNISLVPYECTPPIAIVADTVTFYEVTFSFTDTIPYHHDWDVAIAAENAPLDEASALVLHDEFSYTFTNLEGGTPYTIYVRAHCDEPQVSEWISLSVTTTTTDTNNIVNHDLDHSISIYPNPTTQYVDVLCKHGIIISKIEIYDSYGKMSLYSEINENPKRISVADLAPGMYLMRIITDCGPVTKTIIKR